MGLKNQTNRLSNILTNIKTAQGLATSASNPIPLGPEADADLNVLLEGQLELEGLMPWSSNYTFLVRLDDSSKSTQTLAIYKPCQGERPLWDFPSGMLCWREFASYLISQVLSWPRIPPTILRDGPHGEGSVQLFIDAEYEAHYFNMRHIPTFVEEFRRVALFDYIVNNADRKGGHCLKGKDGQLWAIDHGLTFHTDFKLRTVIWEFCQDPIPPALLEDLERLQNALETPEFCQMLALFINSAEIQAFKNRLKRLISTRCFPGLHSGRNVPFPPI